MTPLPNTDASVPLRIALLIDADNVHPSFADEMFAVLAELGVVTLRRAYGNFGKPEVQKWHAAMRQHAVAPVHQHDLVAGKNATDIRLAIDAIELVVEKQCDVLAIASSDSDFSPLAIRLRERGVPVIGFAQRGKTAADLAAAFDSFHLLDRQAVVGNVAAPRQAAAAGPGRSVGGDGGRGGGTRARRPRRGAAAQAGVALPANARAPVAAASPAPAPITVAAPVPTSVAMPRPVAAPAARQTTELGPAAPELSAELATEATESTEAVAAPRKRRSTSKRTRALPVDAHVEASASTEASDEPPPPAPTLAPDVASPASRVATQAGRPRDGAGAETSTGPEAHWPAGIAAILAAVPGLQSGEVALNSASESLRRAGILQGRSASPSRLFKKYPEYFELLPPNRPKTVHFIG